MCFHDEQDFEYYDLVNFYRSAKFAKVIEEMKRCYHNNGFDHNLSPVYKNDAEVTMMRWGLIPYWTKSPPDALMIRTKTLNCISEEGYEKPSFRDSLLEGKRCLIPITGFYEWRWMDKSGKNKIPYYIFLRDQKIFSLAGIYSQWTDRTTGEEVRTYSILTTKANPLMEKIHNNKKRMPVIIHKEQEQEWLSAGLTKNDVMNFCKPFPQEKMDAYTISKLITSRTHDSNQPKVKERVEYPELALID